LLTPVVPSLADGDVSGAVHKVIAAARAPLRPPSIVLDAVRTVAVHDGVGLESGSAAPTAAPAWTRHAPTETQSDPPSVTRAALQAADAQDSDTSAPAVAANGATDLSDGNKVTPTTISTSPNRPNVAVRDQIRTAVANFGAVVRKLTELRPHDATTAGIDAAN
jgi:hypothetical protein